MKTRINAYITMSPGEPCQFPLKEGTDPPVYQCWSRFDDSGVWTLFLEFLTHPKINATEFNASVSFMAYDAPRDLLLKGTSFELLRGHHVIATGVLTNEPQSLPTKLSKEPEIQKPYPGVANFIFSDCNLVKFKQHLDSWIKTKWPSNVAVYNNNKQICDSHDDSWNEVLYCETEEMKAAWDNDGFKVTHDGKGPIGITIGEHSSQTLKAEMLHDNVELETTAEQDGEPAYFISSKLKPLCIITPDNPEFCEFSGNVVNEIVKICESL